MKWQPRRRTARPRGPAHARGDADARSPGVPGSLNQHPALSTGIAEELALLDAPCHGERHQLLPRRVAALKALEDVRRMDRQIPRLKTLQRLEVTELDDELAQVMPRPSPRGL